jgi:PncC family amidohydrolase
MTEEDMARDALAQLLEVAREHELTIGLAESMTAGLAAYLLIDQPGAGDVVTGSLVTYGTPTKRTLCDYRGPVISRSCAAAMANAACTLLGADIGLSFTGVAGPSTQEGHPVGTVFIGVVVQQHTETLELHFSGTPNHVRLAAITAAAECARRQILARVNAATCSRLTRLASR